MPNFVLPTLGESVESGTLVKVLVEVGERIEEDQSVLELETDKAVVEVPSNMAGVVGDILVKPGQKLKVGDAIFAMQDGESKSEDKVEAPAKTETKSAPEPAPKSESAPKSDASANGASANSATQNGVSAKAENAELGGGAATTRGDELDNTAPAIEAAQNGSANRGSANGGSANGASSNDSGGAKTLVAAAPSVRRLARELNVDIAQVSGSGERGRISFSDVRAFLEKKVAVAPNVGTSVGTSFVAPPLPDFSKWGETQTQPMSGIRLATARHMARCWAEIPHVTQFDKADITETEKLRKQFGAKAEKAGGKLTVTAIALKVVASALKAFPNFNASLDLASEQLILKKYIHIGVAVDTPRGLIVPVIRDVDQKNIVELAAELGGIGEKARAGKVSLAEMQGGTFTITNLGGIGGTAFTPIVNAPEVAILGIARGANEPFWNGSSFEPRMMCPLSLSYDHRVIDGADGARFLRWIAGALEQPFLLSLEG